MWSPLQTYFSDSLNSGANSEPQRLHWLIEFELQGIVTFDGISVTKLQERIHCQFGSGNTLFRKLS